MYILTKINYIQLPCKILFPVYMMVIFISFYIITADFKFIGNHLIGKICFLLISISVVGDHFHRVHAVLRLASHLRTPRTVGGTTKVSSVDCTAFRLKLRLTMNHTKGNTPPKTKIAIPIPRSQVNIWNHWP